MYMYLYYSICALSIVIICIFVAQCTALAHCTISLSLQKNKTIAKQHSLEQSLHVCPKHHCRTCSSTFSSDQDDSCASGCASWHHQNNHALPVSYYFPHFLTVEWEEIHNNYNFHPILCGSGLIWYTISDNFPDQHCCWQVSAN